VTFEAGGSRTSRARRITRRVCTPPSSPAPFGA
jgi:hypothetical protein